MNIMSKKRNMNEGFPWSSLEISDLVGENRMIAYCNVRMPNNSIHQASV